MSSTAKGWLVVFAVTSWWWVLGGRACLQVQHCVPVCFCRSSSGSLLLAGEKVPVWGCRSKQQWLMAILGWQQRCLPVISQHTLFCCRL